MGLIRQQSEVRSRSAPLYNKNRNQCTNFYREHCCILDHHQQTMLGKPNTEWCIWMSATSAPEPRGARFKKMNFFSVPISTVRSSFAICTLEYILKRLLFFFSQSENKVWILTISVIYLCIKPFSATNQFPKTTDMKEKKIKRKFTRKIKTGKKSKSLQCSS